MPNTVIPHQICKYGENCYNLSCSFKHPNEEIRLQKISPPNNDDRRKGIIDPVGLQCMLESFRNNDSCIFLIYSPLISIF
jgi:hypothetical protein